MGSPLVVELAEIRVADVENTALNTYKDPPNTYRHFVVDGIGDFRDKSHADGFLNYLNSLTDDLQYTIEYPSHDGSLPYMDIFIHADKSTSVYRKPTHTNPDDFSHNQSAPAHHSRTTRHKIAWDRTTILTTTRYKTQLDLTEHTAIKTRNPSLNRTDSAPTCSKLWDPIIPKIACTIKPRPAGISFPKKKVILLLF